MRVVVRHRSLIVRFGCSVLKYHSLVFLWRWLDESWLELKTVLNAPVAHS